MGSELSPFKPPKTPILEDVRTESGTVDDDSAPSDPDLTLILDRWPDLPERTKAAAMALVRGEGD